MKTKFRTIAVREIDRRGDRFRHSEGAHEWIRFQPLRRSRLVADQRASHAIQPLAAPKSFHPQHARGVHLVETTGRHKAPSLFRHLDAIGMEGTVERNSIFKPGGRSIEQHRRFRATLVINIDELAPDRNRTMPARDHWKRGLGGSAV